MLEDVRREQFVAQKLLAASHMQSGLVPQDDEFWNLVPHDAAQDPVDESMQLASAEQVVVSEIRPHLGEQTPRAPSQRHPLSALQDTVKLYRAAQPFTHDVLLGLARQIEISLHMATLAMFPQLAPH